MSSGIHIMLISGGVLIALLCLFYVEAKRGRRFASTLRNGIDRLVLRISHGMHTVFHYFGTGSVRIMAHYVIHRLLGIVVFLLHLIQSYFARLQMRNKKVVRQVQAEKRNTHLEAVRVHKEAVALTDAEKIDLKERSLEG